jgi:hypothetical protein
MHVSGKNESKTTKVFLLGLVVGVCINTLAMYFLFYPSCQENWRNVGKSDARIEVSCQMLQKTKEVFGVLEGEAIVDTLGECKDASIVIIKKDAEFTIRTTR